MAPSSGSLDISASSLSNAYFTSSTSSFTTLVSSDHNTTTSAATTTTSTAVARGLGDRIAERSGCGVPKFKSLPPPSLPISPPSVVSPSSFFGNIPHGLSPAELLDSPILLPSSTILPSPTTGTFPVQGFNWNNSSDMFQQQQGFKNDENNLSDFSFQTQTEPPTSYDMGGWSYQQHAKPGDLSSDKANSRSELNSAQSFSSEIVNVHSTDQSSNSLQSGYNQPVRANGKSDDGYNWRKYGQKHVKGSENPRSYYKCTYPNCPTKKKIETDMNGRVTQIVIKGAHNHPKPQSTRRSSSTSSASSAVVQSYSNHEIPEHSYGSNGNDKMESNSSISVSNDDFEQSTLRGDELGEEQQMHDAKRWKGDVEIEGINSGVVSRAAGREEKVVVQTRSDIDILEDGYRWRKYGQKVVKGNPNPRNYYKCTTPRCPVRKHVERAAHDPGSVRTTYEGKHNHAVPTGRGSGGAKGPLPNNPVREHADTAIRPLALSHNPNFPMLMCNSRPPTVEAQAAYTMEMLPSPGTFGYSRYD